MSSLTMIVVIALAVIVTAAADYVNDWDQPFDFKCPDGQVISYMSSIHDNRKEDRRWEFLCRTVGQTHSCTDSDYVNNFDEPLDFTCPDDKVMTGARSYHDNNYEDRRFGFQCCNVEGRNPRDCYVTDYVNDWDEKLTLMVPEGKVVKGAYSIHDNSREDRRWKYLICSI